MLYLSHAVLKTLTIVSICHYYDPTLRTIPHNQQTSTPGGVTTHAHAHDRMLVVDSTESWYLNDCKPQYDRCNFIVLNAKTSYTKTAKDPTVATMSRRLNRGRQNLKGRIAKEKSSLSRKK